MKRSQSLRAPFKALAAKISAFGKLAVALARTARRSEDRCHVEAARRQAKQLELYSWWMLSELTKELEVLEATASPRCADERREREYAFAMLSVFFLLIKVAQDIQERCAGGVQLVGELNLKGVDDPMLGMYLSPVRDIPILDPG